MPAEAPPTSPTWRPQTPEQEIEYARVLESIMLDALLKHVQKISGEMMALHMSGPVEGFTVPIAISDTPKT